MISFLQKNDGILILVAPLLLVLGSIVIALTVGDAFIPSYHDVVFLNEVFEIDQIRHNRWLNVALTLPIVIACALALNRGVHQFGLIGKLNNIPLLVVVIFFFALPASVNHPLLWLCLFMMVQFLNYCMNILDDKKLNISAFNAGLIGGIISLLMPFFYPIVLIVIGVILLSNNLNLRRLFLSFLGAILPTYLAVMMLYIFNSEHYLLPLKQSMRYIGVEQLSWNWSIISYLIIVMLGLLIASTSHKASTQRERRKWRFEIMLLGTLALGVLYGGFAALAATTLIPITIIVSRAFSLCEKMWLKHLLFYGLIAMCLINIVNP